MSGHIHLLVHIRDVLIFLLAIMLLLQEQALLVTSTNKRFSSFRTFRFTLKSKILISDVSFVEPQILHFANFTLCEELVPKRHFWKM